MVSLWAHFFPLHLKFLFTFNISVSFRWSPLLNHDLLTNCLHYIVPLPLPIHLKLLLIFHLIAKLIVLSCQQDWEKGWWKQTLILYLWLKPALPSSRERLYTFPSFGFSQSFHLLRESSFKSIFLTCLFKINTAYYSFCNCVSLSPT